MAKTSLEYIPEGPSHLGAVVTNNGYSDWSTQDYPTEAAKQQLRFRIIRKRGDYTIYVKKTSMGTNKNRSFNGGYRK